MRGATRRDFIAQLSAMGGIAVMQASVRLNLAGAQEQASTDTLIARMKWMNQPASWKVSGSRIMVQSKPKTDFWRKTFYGYITDNGHFLHLQVTGEFMFEARVGGNYHDLYDQAGLMVRVDAENWMKCGTELVDGVRHASVVFTRDFSDWSTMNDLSNDGPVWWRAVRTKDSVEVLCSLDGTKYTSVRQGYLIPGRPAEVGIMSASPEGNGFESTFEGLKLATLRPAS
jgi:hypothetical protein